VRATATLPIGWSSSSGFIIPTRSIRSREADLSSLTPPQLLVL
jgi:hypothetical protein